MKKISCTIFLVLFFSVLVFSQTIPQKMNYQGVLKDGSGVILPDGSYSLTFKLYNTASGGSALWTETKSVTVQDGVFATQLGSTTQINLPFTEGYYLGVAVAAGSELAPRFPLSSVPYSFMSLNVPDGSVTAAKIPDGQVVKGVNGLKDAVTLVAGSNVTITPSGNNLTISSTGGGGGGISGSGTINYIPLFTGATSIGNSSINQISGGDALINSLRVGLGNSSIETNTVFGSQALNSNTTGNQNLALGFYALKNNTTGVDNAAVGFGALLNNTEGYYNTALGFQTLYSNTTGYSNTAIGLSALYSNQTGSANTAIGMGALNKNTTGAGNTSTGTNSLSSNIDGSYNSAYGEGSLVSNTSGSQNTAFGYQTLNTNTTGHSNTATGINSLFSNTEGMENTAVGSHSLFSNTTGNSNTAFGLAALNANTTANSNSAIGYKALFTNTTGGANTASGLEALYSNVDGSNNTATGYKSLHSNTNGTQNTGNGNGSLFSNTIGYMNTATGMNSLYSNTQGNWNTANGNQALFSNTTGYNNTASGNQALFSNTTGAGNTAVGYNTGPNGAAFYNTTCLGTEATATGNDMVRIGNTFVTSIGGQVGWSTLSDGRFKENVSEDVPGLSFITQLRPVTYQVNKDAFNNFIKIYEKGVDQEVTENEPLQRMQSTQPSEIVTGFLAQEVEQIANNLGFDFSGIDKPENSNDYYGLRYGEFVVPLVKAVQEQQKIIEEMKREIEELKRR